MRYILCVGIFLMLFLQNSIVLAYDPVWYAKDANIDRYQKVIVYPIALQNINDFRWDSEEPFSMYNYELHKRLTRHVTGIKFYELFKMIDDKDALLPYDITKYEKYLAKYDDELKRAKVIQDDFYADGYLTTYFYVRQKEIDRSPEIWTDLSLTSYTEEEGGPDGYRIYNMSTRIDHHCTPAKDSTRYRTEMQFILYDENGNIVMTCINERNSYNSDYDEQYKALKDDFVDFFKDIKKNKYNREEKTKFTKTLKFNRINVPKDTSTLDGQLIFKTIFFAMCDEARKLKNVKTYDYIDDNLATDYYVNVDVKRMDYKPKWIKPYATKKKECLSKNESKWYDKNGNEHTMITKRYADIPVDHFGYYDMSNARQIGATISLYDARTDTLIFSQDYFKTNDKMMDALRDIMKEFYNQLDKFASGKVTLDELQDNSQEDEVLMQGKTATHISIDHISPAEFIDKIKKSADEKGTFEVVNIINKNDDSTTCSFKLKNGSTIDMTVIGDEKNNIKLIKFIVNESDIRGDLITDSLLSILDALDYDVKSFKKAKRYGDSQLTFKFKVKEKENRHYLSIDFVRIDDLRIYKLYASDEKV